CCLLIFASCSKEETLPAPSDPQNFYRLNAFEVDVTPKFRQVKILFQATDFSHNGISDITEDDLDVFENGNRIDLEGDLTITRDSTPFNLQTVLLLDLTRSVEGLVEQIKTASIAMINQKLPDQEIAIYTFDANTRLVQDFTRDRADLIAAINSIPETDLVNSTNLYGAVRDMADLWEDNYTIESITDGSVIIFTDGRHNATPNITLNDAMVALQGKKRFVAALSSPDLDETSLKTLAEREDRYFKADDVAGLESMFLAIQGEIQRLSNSIYYMYYQSPITDPSPYENQLRIEVKNNANRGSDRLIDETFNSQGFGL
ncbi:MAG: VWA domain-containing protein, partial [Bacteroidota bacterium]